MTMSRPQSTRAEPVAAVEQEEATDARLGGDYWRLWGSSSSSTLGDGIYLTALLLLAATLTKDPVQLSMVSLAGTLPWLLFALPGGALVDRLDRRRVMWVTDSVRFAIVAVFAVLVATGHATLWLLVAVSFALASGETLYVTASQSIVPQIVSSAPDRLQRANSRLVSAQILTRDFVGRPLGGALFGVAAWLPVAGNAVSFGVAAALIARVRQGPVTPVAPRRHVFVEVRDGMRWLWRHRLLRSLALMVGVDNFAFMLWNSVLVLMLQERFHLGGFGYGVLTACLGVGGITGSLGVVRLSRRAGLAATMIGAMALEGAATAVLGLAHDRVFAGAALAAVGAGAIGWNVVTVSLRQSIVPAALQGRVNGAYRLIAVVGAPVGAVVGGALASWRGLAAPFLVGAATVAVVAVVATTVVTRRVVEQAQEDAKAPTPAAAQVPRQESAG